MNRRSFLGTLLSTLAGAMMIRSLGQIELLLPKPESQVAVRIVVDPELTRASVDYFGGIARFIAEEQFRPGDLVMLSSNGTARRATRDDLPIGVALEENT